MSPMRCPLIETQHFVAGDKPVMQHQPWVFPYGNVPLTRKLFGDMPTPSPAEPICFETYLYVSLFVE